MELTVGGFVFPDDDWMLPHPEIDVTEIVKKLGPMPDRISDAIQAVIRDHYRQHPEHLDELLGRSRKDLGGVE